MPHPELESPPQAFISGYYMNYPDFKKLVEAFRPAFVQAHGRRGVSPGYMGYAFEFNRWKLNLPEDERAKIPVLRLLHDRTRPADAHNHNPNLTKFFFATRYIDAPEDSIIDDFPEAINELEEDKAQRDDFIAMVKKRTGCAYSLDEATLQFGCFRYDHPLYDDFILESHM